MTWVSSCSEILCQKYSPFDSRLHVDYRCPTFQVSQSYWQLKNGKTSLQDVGVSKNNAPKWMVKIMENPLKMDDLGVPLFLETPMYSYKWFSKECCSPSLSIEAPWNWGSSNSRFTFNFMLRWVPGLHASMNLLWLFFGFLKEQVESGLQ